MKVRKITIADAAFERSPDQDGEVYAGNVVDQRHGGPVRIGYGGGCVETLPRWKARGRIGRLR